MDRLLGPIFKPHPQLMRPDDFETSDVMNGVFHKVNLHPNDDPKKAAQFRHRRNVQWEKSFGKHTG